MRQGAFEYLPKPFDLDELTATVASALERERDPPPTPRHRREDSQDSLPLIGRSPGDAGGLPPDRAHPFRLNSL